VVASTGSATTLNVVAELADVEPVETTIESVNAVGGIFRGRWVCRSIEITIELFLTAGVSTSSTSAFRPQETLGG